MLFKIYVFVLAQILKQLFQRKPNLIFLSDLLLVAFVFSSSSKELQKTFLTLQQPCEVKAVLPKAMQWAA